MHWMGCKKEIKRGLNQKPEIQFYPGCANEWPSFRAHTRAQATHTHTF